MGNAKGSPAAVACPGDFMQLARERIHVNAPYIQVLQELGTRGCPDVRIVPLPLLILHPGSSKPKPASCQDRLYHTFQPSLYDKSNSFISLRAAAGKTTPFLPPRSPLGMSLENSYAANREIKGAGVQPLHEQKQPLRIWGVPLASFGGPSP